MKRTPTCWCAVLVVAACLLAPRMACGAETAATADEGTPRVGLLWWPAVPGGAGNTFVRSLRLCLLKKIANDCPQTRLVPEDGVRDAFFPLMEPGTQPATAEEFAALLARADVKARLRKRLDFLLAFSGGTEEDTRGGVLCGAGYGGGGCFGLAWINKETRIDVVIWDIDQAVPVEAPTTLVEGTTWVPALLLPIPIVAMTESDACRDMGRQIVDFIGTRTRGGFCR